jgi:hypothetical protein
MKTGSDKPKLSPALAANATRSIELRLQKLRAQAQEDIALIKDKQTQILDSFYEIGQALQRLKADGVAQAVGRVGFGDLVEKDLGMSIATADRLIAIVTFVRRSDALRWGQEKSTALVQLAKATADASDSPATLVAKKKLRLTSGRVLDVEAAKAAEIRDAAREERQRRQGDGNPRRGKTTTPEERALAAAVTRALHEAGIESARVSAVATKPGQVANVRIDRIPMDRLQAFGAVLEKVGGSRRRRG